MLRRRIALLALPTLVACSPSPASTDAKSANPAWTGEQKCATSPTRPLIVEWPSSDRASLESQSKHGVVIVRYKGCEMEVLRRCKAPGRYLYTPVTKQDERVVMRDAKELYANVPVYAARFEGALKKSGQLSVAMTAVGNWDSDHAVVRTDELDGDCAQATHVVSTLTAGAFELVTGSATAASASAQVLSAGGGVRTSSESEVLNRAGDPAACMSAPADKDPPPGCGALFRMELTPIGQAKSIPTCGEGTTWDGKQCARPTKPRKLTSFTLPNRLRVVLDERHEDAQVVARVTFNNELGDDAPGRKGASLILQTLLLGDASSKTAFIDRVKALGGTANSVNGSPQNILVGGPSAKLDSLLAELGRALGNARASGDRLADARAHALSLVDTPYARAAARADQLLFPPGHPNRDRADALTDIPKIEAADLSAALSSRFGAANSVLTISGDFDSDHARVLVESTFSNMWTGSPLVRMEPPRSVVSRSRIDAVAPFAFKPRVELRWPSAPFPSREDKVVDVLGTLLARKGTQGTRLGTRLAEAGISAPVDAGQRSSPSGGLFVVTITTEAANFARAESAVIAELRRLASEGPSAAEVRNAAVALEGEVRALTVTNYGRAALFSHVVLFGQKGEDLEATMLGPYETIGVPDIKATAAGLLGSAFVAIELRADPSAPPEGTLKTNPLAALP